jgi:outer membrane receptor for ferrienterochelin and colicin
MEEDPESKVSNTLEMLRKVPLLIVDSEDNVQLKGSSDFKIYINGKPSNLLRGQNMSNVLKSMPANTIKSVEVITDPGVRYDAEGIGGIINIITVRNVFQGYQGTAQATTRTFEHTGQIDYTNPLTLKHSIETGLKYILRQNISRVKQYEMGDSSNWVELPSTSNNDFKHVSNIYAVYAGYTFNSPKFGFRSGVRAE